MWTSTTSTTYINYSYNNCTYVTVDTTKCTGCGKFLGYCIDNKKYFCKKCTEKGKQLNLFGGL